MTTNNIQKAKELIGCFATGDTAKAKSLLKDNYIQHNLAYATGAEAFCGKLFEKQLKSPDFNLRQRYFTLLKQLPLAEIYLTVTQKRFFRRFNPKI